MRKINKPSSDVITVLTDCIENMQNTILKAELLGSISVFKDAESDFEIKKTSNTLHLISQKTIVSEIANCKELKKIYTDRMTKKTNKGRIHYDNIMISAPNGKCPFCAQRTVSTLDHYLPKSLYPILSVTPLNLIPSCFDCNNGKLVDYPSCSAEESLHPYFDDIEAFSWLEMTIIQVKPLLIKFDTNPPAHIPKLLKDRIKFHFDTYSLNALYTTHAAEEFANIYIQITKLYKRGGETILQEHLLDCYESMFSNNKNSWQTAFYHGLSNNMLFCNGGFI